MTDNQLDQFFRENLKDHSAAVPEGLWEKIRSEKDRKPMGFFLTKKTAKGLMLAALLVGATAIAFEINQYNKVTNTDINPSSLNNSNTQNSTLSNSTAAQPVLSNENAGPQQNNILPTVNHGNNIQVDKVSQDLSETDLRSSQSNAFIQAKTNSNYTVNNQLKLSLDENSGEYNTVSTDDATVNYTASKHSTGNTVSLSPTGSKQQLGMVNKQLAANAHDKKFKSIIICPTIRGKSSSFNSDWGLEIFASPDYAFKSVSANTAPQQYLDKKDSSEQMQLGFSAGLRLVKPLNDHVLLKTGFQYSQVNEKFVYRNENEIKTTTVVTVRTIIRSPGDTIQVSDTSVLQQIGYSVKTSFNRYRSIDIPLTVGYQFGNGDWKLAINAGVIFNIASWYQGEMLDSSYTPVSISKASNTIYKTNIGMGLYSSISVVKKINENAHLFFEPYFRYNLQDMTNSQAPFNQRFHIGGLAIGLRFNLNR